MTINIPNCFRQADLHPLNEGYCRFNGTVPTLGAHTMGLIAQRTQKPCDTLSIKFLVFSEVKEE